MNFAGDEIDGEIAAIGGEFFPSPRPCRSVITPTHTRARYRALRHTRCATENRYCRIARVRNIVGDNNARFSSLYATRLFNKNIDSRPREFHNVRDKGQRPTITRANSNPKDFALYRRCDTLYDDFISIKLSAYLSKEQQRNDQSRH